MHARTDHTGQLTDVTDLAASIQASIRADLDASGDTGAPPLGHLAGLHRKPADGGRYALALDPTRPALTGGAGVLEFAMLADLALGGVIRNQIGLALPLPTVSMTIQLAPGRTREVAWADAECTVQLERTASARSQLFTADGEVVGDAVGVFALPKLPYDGPGRGMPWDLPLDDHSPKKDPAWADESVPLSADRESLVDSIHAHAAGDPDCAWGTQHVAEQLISAGEGAGEGVDGFVLTPTPPMVNRLGHVQGGVLFTAAVLAAARAAGFPVETLTTATIKFIEAADLDGPLVPEVTVLRAGGRSLFTSTVLVQNGRARSHVSAVFRR